MSTEQRSDCVGSQVGRLVVRTFQVSERSLYSMRSIILSHRKELRIGMIS